MSDKMYNLQVPIPMELKEELKKLAKEDDRSLRAFCKRILEGYVNGSCNIDSTLKTKNTRSEDKEETKTKDSVVNFNFEDMD